MYVRLKTNGRMQPKFGIFFTPSPKILDVFDRFFGRKNVCLGVNGNAGYFSVYIALLMCLHTSSVSVSVSLCLYLYICLSLSISVYRPLSHPSSICHLPIDHLMIHPAIHPSTNPHTIHPSVRPSIHPSIILSVSIPRLICLLSLCLSLSVSSSSLLSKSGFQFISLDKPILAHSINREQL